ncbi:hypothetical protein HCH_01859 [Hahella chejuensis KCTC 2396]|uniref:Uncharacterized protein n=1 Tax=Hahella chejuensis (strain KCTC 2396) TaxID=349521 RepID=Q2SKX8_HAHCH|nr:hypothetical protein HCH_01859 [Hahella chejuensis KCTC 2396]
MKQAAGYLTGDQNISPSNKLTGILHEKQGRNGSLVFPSLKVLEMRSSDA